MIVPLHGEDEWTAALAALPAWQPPLLPTVIVSPHPDDETLGCGGLIARLIAAGVQVTVVAATDGEHAYPEGETQQSARALADVRQREQEEALRTLGVRAENIVRLRLCDSGLAANAAALTEGLRKAVEGAGANVHVVAPWHGDFHPDHEACALAAASVARQSGARLTSYIFWTWHRGGPEMLRNSNACRMALTPEERETKWDALNFHASQLFQQDGHPILPNDLLWPARQACEVYFPQ
jgi:LmbE family N-acetylglucosaminyl deacetylase